MQNSFDFMPLSQSFLQAYPPRKLNRRIPMQELTHYLNGEHVKGTSGRFADVFNPATGEVQAKCPLANEAEMDQAVKYA
ncbi:MAG: hypothetical protein ACI9LZ_003625, partial [Glaciecola sp.]